MRKRGFTLIELLVVIAIIAILAVVFCPAGAFALVDKSGSSQNSTMTISGMIYQKDLVNRILVLPEAYVDILSLDRLHIIATAVTLPNGTFVVTTTGLPTGSYVIRVSERGYISYEGVANLRLGSSMPFVATLAFDPYDPPAEIFNDPTTSSRKSDGKAYSPNGLYYSTRVRASDGWRITVYRISTGQIVFQLPGTANDPKAIAWSRDNSAIAVMYHGSWAPDSAIHLYDASTGLLLRDIVHESLPWYPYMVFSADGTMVLCGDSSRVATNYPSGFGTTIGWFKESCGVNLPWENYGWDLGVQPWGGAHGGYSDNLVKLESDFALMAEHHVRMVRIFLFADIRSGLVYDGLGNPIGFDQYVYADMDVLITVAEKYHIKLILVLFDYKMADGITHDIFGKMVGEHPELITDPAKRMALRSQILQFVNRYRSRQCVSSWEIMNEPEYATAVLEADMKSFLSDCLQSVQSGDQAKATVGLKDRGSFATWSIPNTTLFQYHYYGFMEESYPFDYPASGLGLKYPVIIGECQPGSTKYSLSEMLTLANNNGYAGILFWSLNTNYTIPLDEYLAWMISH